jgi:hypothetical protein
MAPLSLAWRMYACVAGVEATASKLQIALNSPGDLEPEQRVSSRTGQHAGVLAGAAWHSSRNQQGKQN